MKYFKNIKQFTLLLSTLACGIIIFAGPAQTVSAALFDGSVRQACKGANLSNSNGTCGSARASSDISTTLQRIVNILTMIVGIAAVIMIIINGLKFITSNGDSNAISSARNGVIYSLVGLAVVALAQVIVRFVINTVN